MSYIKVLKKAFYFSALIFGISLLTFRKIDFYACVLVLITFLLMAIEDAGQLFLNTTNQTGIVKTVFGAIVKPFSVFFCLASFFYVCVGEINWFFWGVSGGIATLVFFITIFS